LTSELGIGAASRISLGGAVVTYRLALLAFEGKLDEFIENMTIFEASFREGVNWNTNETVAKISLWLVLISTIILLIVYVVLMSLTLKGKCLGWGKCLQGVLALFKILFGIIILLLGIISIVLSVLAVNGCYLAKKGMDDRNFMEKLVNNSDRMSSLQ